MRTIENLVAAARRRLWAQAALCSLAWLALAALAAAGLLRTGEQALGWSLPWQAYAALALAAAMAAPLMALVRRPTAMQAATLLDARLGLKDRLATALHARGMVGNPFARQVLRDAQAAATGLRARDALPWRLEHPWGWTPLAAALLALLWVFLPADVLGLERARAQREQAAARGRQDEAQVKQHLTQVQATIRQVAAGSPNRPSDAEMARLAAQLADLTNRDLTQPQAQRDAMAKLSSAQDDLARLAERKDAQVQTVKAAMSRLENLTPGPADRFADALRRGDFEAARRALGDLAQQATTMPAEQRQALRKQLDELARQLDQAARDAADRQARADEQMRQDLEKALKDAGVSEQQARESAKELAEKLRDGRMSPQELKDALERQGVSPQHSRQLGDKAGDNQQQRDGSKQGQEGAGKLSESLQRMAREVDPNAPPRAGTQPAGQDGQQTAQQDGQQPGTQPQSAQGGARQAQEQLEQLERMQRDLRQLRQSQGQLQQAMQDLSQQGDRREGQAPGGQDGRQARNPFSRPNPQDPSSMQQQNGPGYGTEPGGQPLGRHREMTGYDTEAVTDAGDPSGQGPHVVTGKSMAELLKGDAATEYSRTVTSARDRAEQAVTEDRVPQRYHQAIRDYFNQLPDTPEPVKSAPPAPR